MGRNGIHFAVMGPSASGKSTGVQQLKDKFPGLGLQKQRNYTTRAKRESELVHGSDYIHISDEEYEYMKESGLYIGHRISKETKDNKEIITKYGGIEPDFNKTVFITDHIGYGMLKERGRKTQEEIVGIFFDAEKEVCHHRMLIDRPEDADGRTAIYETFLPGKYMDDVIVIDANRPLELVTEELYEILHEEIMRNGSSL